MTPREAKRKGLVPCAEAAVEIGMARATIERWCREGKLPGAKQVGQRWYLQRVALDRFLGLSDSESK